MLLLSAQKEPLYVLIVGHAWGWRTDHTDVPELGPRRGLGSGGLSEDRQWLLAAGASDAHYSTRLFSPALPFFCSPCDEYGTFTALCRVVLALILGRSPCALSKVVGDATK